MDGFVFYLKTQGRAQPTIKNYTTYAKQWLDWCLECGIHPAKATTEDLMSWLGWMTDNRMPSTVRLATLSLRVYYDYLKAGKLLKTNPARNIAVRKQVSRPVAQLEPHEVKRLIGACETLEDKAMVLLMVGGGLRRSEVLNITREDIDFTAGTIRIYGKGRKWREIAPGQTCMSAVKAALAWRPRLFTSTHPDSLRRRLNLLAERSGIGREIHPHMLRYYFAVHFCELGVEGKENWQYLTIDGMPVGMLPTVVLDRIIADHAALREARAALENLADYWQPCDVDAARDYCVVHHEKHCQGMKAYDAARDILAADTGDQTGEG